MSFGSEAVHLLQKYGVDTVFGIPGVHTIEYYRGVAETGVKSIVPRHEQGAGFMADGYSRISGRPGVCILVSGPGVLNAATPIAQAWHDSIPMLVLAASTDSSLRGKNRGPLHDVPDQAAFFEQLCDRSVTVTDPDQFTEVIAETFLSWSRNRNHPVHISIPTDLLTLDITPMHAQKINVVEKRPIQPDLVQLKRLLEDSKSPLIIAGGGAIRAGKELQEFADLIQAPVISTGNARGILPQHHPLNVGTILPFRGARSLIEKSDLVLALGTEFSDVDIIYSGIPIPAPKRLVRVDVDPTQLNAPYHANLAIESDVGSFLRDSLDSLRGLGFTGRNPNAFMEVNTAKADIQWTDQSRSHFGWIDAISTGLPENAIVSIDSTQLAYTAHHYQPWSSPSRWLAPYGLGTLGPALPMGLGAKVASPADPVLIIAGDGGFLFTLSELATARDIGGTIITIIWDNAGYGEIRDSFDRAHAPRIGVDATSYDLVTIAQGFGLEASRVGSPEQLHDNLAKNLKSLKPTLIVATEPGSPASSIKRS
jgi:thiamine pyrophosphate-dependent acetolactate synthase large subunit-like protein